MVWMREYTFMDIKIMLEVAPNIGGPSYILKDGLHGILFKAGDKNDLCKKLTSVINGEITLEKEEIIKRGKCFSISNQADAILGEFQ